MHKLCHLFAGTVAWATIAVAAIGSTPVRADTVDSNELILRILSGRGEIETLVSELADRDWVEQTNTTIDFGAVDDQHDELEISTPGFTDDRSNDDNEDAFTWGNLYFSALRNRSSERWETVDFRIDSVHNYSVDDPDFSEFFSGLVSLEYVDDSDDKGRATQFIEVAIRDFGLIGEKGDLNVDYIAFNLNILKSDRAAYDQKQSEVLSFIKGERSDQRNLSDLFIELSDVTESVQISASTNGGELVVVDPEYVHLSGEESTTELSLLGPNSESPSFRLSENMDIRVAPADVPPSMGILLTYALEIEASNLPPIRSWEEIAARVAESDGDQPNLQPLHDVAIVSSGELDFMLGSLDYTLDMQFDRESAIGLLGEATVTLRGLELAALALMEQDNDARAELQAILELAEPLDDGRHRYAISLEPSGDIRINDRPAGEIF